MVIAGGLGVAAVGAGLVAFSAVPAVLAGSALFGLGEGFVLVFHMTLRASATPEGYFGRVTGVAGVLNQIAGGLSIVWLGLVLHFAPGRAAFIALGAAVLALATWVAVAPKPALPSAPAQAANPEAASARPAAAAS